MNLEEYGIYSYQNETEETVYHGRRDDESIEDFAHRFEMAIKQYQGATNSTQRAFPVSAERRQQ